MCLYVQWRALQIRHTMCAEGVLRMLQKLERQFSHVDCALELGKQGWGGEMSGGARVAGSEGTRGWMPERRPEQCCTCKAVTTCCEK